MDQHIDDGPNSTILTLPMELLVYIIAILPTARDKVNLWCVSRRMRTACQTQSLWTEFVWPYYRTGDESYFNCILKANGKFLKKLWFPDHVTPSTLVKLTRLCGSVKDLSIPTTKLDPQQMEQVVQNMRCLQRLDIQWNIDFKQLLVVLINADLLKELTIRIEKNIDGLPYVAQFSESVDVWLQYWISNGFVPQSLNVVLGYAEHLYPAFYDNMLERWVISKPKIASGQVGHFKLYTNTKASMDLFSVAPEFQLEFGETASLPYVISSNFGLLSLKKDVLLLTDCADHSKTVHKAKPLTISNKTVKKDHLDFHTTSLDLVTYFDASYCEWFKSKHLEQLAIACPSLCRLNLRSNGNCLKSLQGLQIIAGHCKNLQGLNLMDIEVTEVENHLQLWEILSDMKLTHLAIDLCIFLPSVGDDEQKEKLMSLYQKCTSVQAVEFCTKYKTQLFDITAMLLSHFPSLCHCVFTVNRNPYQIGIENIITGCKELKYLNYSNNFVKLSFTFLSVSLCHNLRQIFLKASRTEIPDAFMTSLSAHGELVHVVLFVRSVTSEGISLLITNSPKLMTFHAFLYEVIYAGECTKHTFEARLKENFSYQQLFKLGSYKVVLRDQLYTDTHQQEYENNTDLLSLW